MAIEEALVRKIAVLGYRGVGKSSLCARLVEDEYSPDYQPTIENTFSASLEFPEARVRFDCEIDEYSEMSRRASVGVHGYLLVFAVNSRASFEKLSIIHERLLEVVSDDRVPVVLVGNKVDALAEREVTSADARAFAERIRAPYMECSARTNQNVVDAFKQLMREVERESGVIKPRKAGSMCLVL